MIQNIMAQIVGNKSLEYSLFALIDFSIALVLIKLTWMYLKWYAKTYSWSVENIKWKLNLPNHSVMQKMFQAQTRAEWEKRVHSK